MCKFVAFDMLNPFENCDWFVSKVIIIMVGFFAS